jgi:antitoxin VapB
MKQIAKVFMTGRSQAVRIPAEFRFNRNEVFIRRDQKTGDIILSTRPTWKDILAQIDPGDIPEDFLSPEERNQQPPREPRGF